MRMILAVLALILVPFAIGASLAITHERSQPSEWLFEENLANQFLRGKTVKGIYLDKSLDTEGALQGRRVKDVRWIGDGKLLVNATDGSSFLYEFRVITRAELSPAESLTIETTDGIRAVISPAIHVRDPEILPHAKTYRGDIELDTRSAP